MVPGEGIGPYVFLFISGGWRQPNYDLYRNLGSRGKRYAQRGHRLGHWKFKIKKVFFKII